MSETFSIRIAKDDLVFSAAHFITFDGGTCERLHGHNYRVAVDVAGPLDENHYVVDFVALHRLIRETIAPLDQRILLPAEHRQIRLETTPTEITATFQDRRWVFPAEDCVLLPIGNTTTERLAAVVGRRLLEAYEATFGRRPDSLRLKLYEDAGVSAVWHWRP